MGTTHSDALVFFWATGDLAYKKIFPSLQAMLKRGTLDVPVIGVAKAGWNLDQMKARAKDSLEKHGGLDPAAFAKLSGLLKYVDGDYNDPATFAAIRQALGAAQRPAYYLAIPPVLVRRGRRAAGRVRLREGRPRHRREAFRNRPRLDTGAEPDPVFAVSGVVDLSHRPLPREAAGHEPDLLSFREFLAGAVLEPRPYRKRPDHHGGGLRGPGPRRALRWRRDDPRCHSEHPGTRGRGTIVVQAREIVHYALAGRA